MDWQELRQLAPAGVLRRDAAEQVLSPAAVDRWVAAGKLQRPTRGTVALPGADLAHRRTRIRSTALSLPCLGGVAGWTALWLWGLLRTPPTADAFAVETRWPPTRPGATISASRDLARDLVVLDGMLVTSVARTLADLAAVVEVPALRGLVLDALQRRLCAASDLEAMCGRRRGAKGIAKLRRVLAQIDPEAADSQLEWLTRSRLRTTSLPRPHRQPLMVPTPDGWRQLDVPWPRSRVAIDCDGRAYHADRAGHDRDAVRRNELAGDWLVATVTWTLVERRFDVVITTLRRLLARADQLVATGVWSPFEVGP